MAYATLQQIRDDGLTEEQASDDRVNELLADATAYIDFITGMWFEPRDLTVKIDGSGRAILPLYIPIIEIIEARVDDAVIDSGNYVVYNRIYPDDRVNPRVVYKSVDSSGGTVFTGASAAKWKRGLQNVELDGTFGYTDFEDPDYVTPQLINRACRLLVFHGVPRISDYEAQSEQQLIYATGAIKKEVTDRHSYELETRGGGETSSAVHRETFGLTGNLELDGILMKYRSLRPRYAEVV